MLEKRQKKFAALVLLAAVMFVVVGVIYNFLKEQQNKRNIDSLDRALLGRDVIQQQNKVSGTKIPKNEEVIKPVVPIAGSDKVWVQKHLTQCNEAWDEDNWKGGFVDRNNNEQIKNFFEKELKIFIYEIQSKSIEGEECEACDCLGGNQLILLIGTGDLVKMAQLGYYQEQKCSTNNDCYVTCAWGCKSYIVPRDYDWDCKAMPDYRCICQDNICIAEPINNRN